MEGDSRDNFTLERIQEVRTRIQLKRKENEEEVLQNEKNTKDLESTINKILKENKANRKILAEAAIGSDQKILSGIFRSSNPVDKKDFLSIKNKPLENAVTIMDDKAFQLNKELDNLRYERGKLEKKVRDVREQLLIFDHWMTKRKDKSEAERNLRLLENKLEKIRMKTETAESIGEKYEQVISCLSEDFQSMPKRLEQLEMSLKEYKIEQSEMNELARKAIRTRDNVKKELIKLEKTTMDDRLEKERELIKTRKDVESRRREAQERHDRLMFKALPTQINGETQADKAEQKKKEMTAEVMAKLANLDDIIKQLQAATRVTDVQNIVERVVVQQEVRELLELQKREAERNREYLTSLRDEALEELIKARYSGEETASNWNKISDKMYGHLTDAKNQLKDKKLDLENQAKILHNVQKGIKGIIERLVGVPDPAQQESPELDDKLKQCYRKLLSLQSIIKTFMSDFDPQKQIATNEFYEFVEKRLPEKNCRVNNIEIQTSNYANDLYESDDNEDALTREDLKKVTNDVLTSLVHKRKKKKVGQKHYQQPVKAKLIK